MRRVRLILLVGSVVALRPVHAQLSQWQLSGDAGVSHLRQTGIPESNALTFGGTFDAVGERAFLHSSLLTARATENRWTGQGLITGAVVDPSMRPIRWELTGTLSAFGQSNERPTSSGEAAARLRVGSLANGAIVGVGGGATTHAGAAASISRLLGGAYASAGAHRFGVDLSLTRTGSQTVNRVVPLEGSTYLDGAAWWRLELGGLSLGATAGVRDAQRGIVTGGAWASADASLWLTPHSALVLSAGRTLEDAVRGVPSATYASVAIRLAVRPHVTLRRRVVAGPRARARRAASGEAIVEVFAPRASRVEIAADFTGWAPVSLARSDDAWQLSRPVAAGAHRITVRIDGGEWIVPPNLPKVEDDLGSSAGVIIIP